MLSVVQAGQPAIPLELKDFSCFAAGYTGRDRAAVNRHIRELEEHGVPPPKRVPCCFPILSRLLAPGAELVEVIGSSTSGEMEPVLILLDGQPRYIGAGSDHTDRELERYSTSYSKQLCPKVISQELWEFSQVADHWDDLELTSWSDGDLYQSARLDAMLPVDDLIATVPAQNMTAQVVLFCGTVALVNGLRFANHFAGSLRDPSADRSLTVSYAINVVDPID
jgi:hypothetical protein